MSFKGDLSTPYKKSADQAEEHKTSAWTLLTVGTLGLVLLALCIVGILPFRPGNPVMFYGIMGAVFSIFMVMGFVSMKNAAIYAKQAKAEALTEEELLAWCRENVKAEELEKELSKEEPFEEIQQEELYFKRYDKLKERLTEQFPQCNPAYIDSLMDETIYDMVFGE